MKIAKRSPNRAARRMWSWPSRGRARPPMHAVTASGSESVLNSKAHSQVSRILIAIDSAYTLKGIRQRGIEASITCRDLDGYFDRVVSVNPLATASYSGSEVWAGRGRVTRLDERHEFVDVSHHRLNLTRWSPRLEPIDLVLSQIDLLRQLVYLAGKYDVTIVRGGDPLYSGLLALALARRVGAPVVVRVGGNNEQAFLDTGLPAMPRLFRSRRIERWVERFVLSHADYVIGANLNNLEFALASGARRDRASVIHYGSLLSPEHFVDPASRGYDGNPFERLGVRPGAQVIMYVGRLELVKRPQDLVSVMRLLDERGRFPHLVVAGEGSAREQLERDAISSGLSDRIHFVGNQPQSWLAKALPKVDLVLSPHTGRALAEAALAGTPVVCYDVDWQTEIVEDGVSGIVVDYADTRSMADAAEFLLGSPELARQLGAALRQRALVLLDPQSLRNAERAVYDRALGEMG